MSDLDLIPDVLSPIPGESGPDRFVRAALLAVGASATKNVPLFTRVVIRPLDRNAAKLPYYLKDPDLSTCQLLQMALARIVTGTLFLAPYVPSKASEEQEKAYAPFGAMTTPALGCEMPLKKRSDGFWIANAAGGDLHASTCIADPIRIDDDHYTVETVEGGQEDAMGWTMTERFSDPPRSLVRKNGLWMMGERHIIRVIDHSLLPAPYLPMPTPGGVADDSSVPA
jgi:hypothetical protein